MSRIWELSEGVVAPNGCNPDGRAKPAWIVVCHHLMSGMVIFGPFTSEQSAANWRREHVREELEDIGDPAEWTVLTEMITVPTLYVGGIGN